MSGQAARLWLCRGGGNLSQKTGCQEDKRASYNNILSPGERVRERGRKFGFTLAEAFHPAEQLRKNAFTLAEVFYPTGKSRKTAFTLAEVLITLGIIGVVAALVMPGLIAKHNERQTVVRLKHTYSILSQAITNMIAEYGNLNIWSDESKEFFEQELKKQLKVVGEQRIYS